MQCDEERPICRHCARRGEECDISDNPANTDATHTAVSNPSQSPGSERSRIALPLSRSLTNSGSTAGMAGLTLLDMELLHHYSVSTALTLSPDPAVRNYFQVNVPQLGFSHIYVLQCVLALAASHLAHFRPEARRYYYSHAKARHTAATSVATPLLSNISKTNVIPMYCFSITTLFIAFASLRDEEDLLIDAGDVTPSWLAMFRGVRTVLESDNRAIYKSSVSYLFYSSETNKIWEFKQSDQPALLDFLAHIESLAVEDEQTKELLLNAFQNLRRAFYFFYEVDLGNESRIRALFSWMYKVPDGFLVLLRQRNSTALCILAFFCILLHRLEHNWWFQGWGTHLIERLYEALDEVHRFRITWPVQEIGWIPKREMSHTAYYSTPPTT